MATLTGISVGDSAAPNNWTSSTNGNLGDGSDLTFGGVTTNADGDYTQGWLLDDPTTADTDFGTMLTLACIVRYGWSTATPTNTTWEPRAIEVYITDSGGTIQLAGGSSTLAVTEQMLSAHPTDADITVRATASQAFTYVNTTATSTQWDGAIVVIAVGRNRAKGGGTDEQRIMTVDFTGTYTPAVTPATIEQKAFRFRDGTDTPTLNANTNWGAALNTDLTAINVDSDYVVRLRMLLQNDHASIAVPSTGDYQLQYRVNAGSWDFIGSGGAFGVEVALSGQYADGDVTTQVIGSGTFQAGDGVENGSDALNRALTATNEIEHEWIFTLASADLNDGDDIDFRVVWRMDAEAWRAPDTVTQTPSIAVVKTITFPVRRETSSGFNNTSETGYTVALDDGAAVAGDLAIIHMVGSSTTGKVTTTTGVPSGWTEVFNRSHTDYSYWLGWKVLTAGDISTPTAIFSCDAAGLHAHQIDIITIDTFASADPIDVSDEDFPTATSAGTATVTTTGGSELLMIYAGMDISTAGTWTIDTGTENFDSTLGSEFLSLAGYESEAATATTYNRTATSDQATQDLHVAMLAVNSTPTSRPFPRRQRTTVRM